MFNKLTKRGFCTAISSRPWLFVGLGNPGEKFKGTRHNVGFEMIDVFAESVGIPMNRVHCKAVFGEGFVGDIPVFLAKPQTYMNLSGESAGPLAAYYKLPLNRVLVFHDDMNLPCGVLRLQHNGGHDYHNGHSKNLSIALRDQGVVYHVLIRLSECYLLPRSFFNMIPLNMTSSRHATTLLLSLLKSVIYHFRGNREFARLRIGIGRPPGQMDPKAFLLQKFNNTAQERIDTALQEGVAALKLLLSLGLSESARRFNHEQKYKHIRLQTMPV